MGLTHIKKSMIYLFLLGICGLFLFMTFTVSSKPRAGKDKPHMHQYIVKKDDLTLRKIIQKGELDDPPQFYFINPITEKIITINRDRSNIYKINGNFDVLSMCSKHMVLDFEVMGSLQIHKENYHRYINQLEKSVYGKNDYTLSINSEETDHIKAVTRRILNHHAKSDDFLELILAEFYNNIHVNDPKKWRDKIKKSTLSALKNHIETELKTDPDYLPKLHDFNILSVDFYVFDDQKHTRLLDSDEFKQIYDCFLPKQRF